MPNKMGYTKYKPHPGNGTLLRDNVIHYHPNQIKWKFFIIIKNVFYLINTRDMYMIIHDWVAIYGPTFQLI